MRLRASAEELRAVVGTAYELTYTLAAVGRLPSQAVRFALQQPPLGVVESATADGVTCTTDPDFTTCDFGALNPGDVRTVVVRFHMTQSVPSFMSASARWTTAAGNQFSTVYTSVYANLTVDVAADLKSRGLRYRRRRYRAGRNGRRDQGRESRAERRRHDRAGPAAAAADSQVQ